MPEIRVWVHPLKGGDCYYYVFASFRSAYRFIISHPLEAEDIPLVAIAGYELNLFDIPKGLYLMNGRKVKL